ncbi:hypothetical protein [Saccharopolyspora halophila]|uniref:hypothetical protein n=1 Tax=Saccharopolyspora halophila TaxID=405551 RepID=UPI0031DAAD3F
MRSRWVVLSVVALAVEPGQRCVGVFVDRVLDAVEDAVGGQFGQECLGFAGLNDLEQAGVTGDVAGVCGGGQREDSSRRSCPARSTMEPSR